MLQHREHDMRGVKNYHHYQGVHCGSAALRNVISHYSGLRLSEAMCFGLGAGINFTYVREPGASFYMVTGRGSYLEANFCDALDIHMEVTSTSDDGAAWRHLRGCVERGELVMIDTDMFELPYMVQRLKLSGGLHFGGHKALVVGYDATLGTVALADYAWKSPQQVSLSVLQAARGSKLGVSCPGNACFRFYFPDELPCISHAIRIALNCFVNQMRRPYLHYNGLPAVIRFCRQVTKWNRIMGAEELQNNTGMAAFMLEKAGTGGGAFRNLYSRFLEESAEVFHSPLLRRASGVYRDLATRWREVAALLAEAAACPSAGIYRDSGMAATRLLTEVAEKEAQGVQLIECHMTQHATATVAQC